MSKFMCVAGSVCDGHRCSVDRQCSVDENNRAVCGCLQSCSYDYNPVCGSDGITYQNLCDFRRLTCMAHVSVTVVRTGQCSYGRGRFHISQISDIIIDLLICFGCCYFCSVDGLSWWTLRRTLGWTLRRPMLKNACNL